ncbi:MAG: sulfite exporter TauE/SafE family protein, partial [Cyanobacteria bacterium J06597_16]
FTPAAMLGAYLGSQLVKLPWITDTLQLVSFGLVMLAASILMIQKGPSRQDRSASQGAILSHRPASNLPKQASVRTGSKQAWYGTPLWKNFAIPIEGLGVGIVTGFVGVGGGFLIIPALVLLSHIPIKKAVGTSLLIISLNSAVGFVGYLNQVSIDWSLTLSFTLAAAIGIFLGSSLSKKIAASRLQKGFGYFVLIVATFVLIKR